MILALKTDSATNTEAWLFAPQAAESKPSSAAAATKPIATLAWDSGRRLSDELLGRLTSFLDTHHIKLHELTGIIIFSGPGSFTSLRIGHTVVDALADSLGIPVIGASGPGWLMEGRHLLATAKPGHPALPVYGAEAHITRSIPPSP